jgi:UDP-2,3-diacylglucosamine hydrolase
MHDPHTSTIGMAHSARPDPVALFVSDVHLQASMPRTAQAFFEFLRRRASQARQLYLLGDLFEYWAGDDDIDTPFSKQAIDAIRQVSDAGVAVFWIAGNRDFLVGADFARATGTTLLPDPFVATIGDKRILLTHGDAQCTDDAAYMAYRSQVRQPAWQANFLAMPLAQRKAIIEGLRDRSREAQRAKSYDIMDVNTAAVEALFDATGTAVMIHGHTHRPGRHEYLHDGDRRTRYVLPDWDCDAEVRRGGWLEVGEDGEIRPCGLDDISV